MTTKEQSQEPQHPKEDCPRLKSGYKVSILDVPREWVMDPSLYNEVRDTLDKEFSGLPDVESTWRRSNRRMRDLFEAAWARGDRRIHLCEDCRQAQKPLSSEEKDPILDIELLEERIASLEYRMEDLRQLLLGFLEKW